MLTPKLATQIFERQIYEHVPQLKIKQAAITLCNADFTTPASFDSHKIINGYDSFIEATGSNVSVHDAYDVHRASIMNAILFNNALAKIGKGYMIEGVHAKEKRNALPKGFKFSLHKTEAQFLIRHTYAFLSLRKLTAPIRGYSHAIVSFFNYDIII